jgi:redox-sensing transcriptional repressor
LTYSNSIQFLAVEKTEIPKKTVYRLSLYLRCLDRLLKDERETISSNELADTAGVKPPQLRKDLGHIGHVGTRGLGYSIIALRQAITRILNTASLQPVVLVGVGNLGAALMRYAGFKKEGFEIVAAFDLFPEIAKERCPDSEIPIYDVDALHGIIVARNIKMAILCVPADRGQLAAETLVNSGIQAILNFSPTVLRLPHEVFVNHVDLALELDSLSYFLSTANHQLT